MPRYCHNLQTIATGRMCLIFDLIMSINLQCSYITVIINLYPFWGCCQWQSQKNSQGTAKWQGERYAAKS
jgi:hypothetical protein